MLSINHSLLQTSMNVPTKLEAANRFAPTVMGHSHAVASMGIYWTKIESRAMVSTSI